MNGMVRLIQRATAMVDAGATLDQVHDALIGECYPEMMMGLTVDEMHAMLMSGIDKEEIFHLVYCAARVK